MSNPFFWLSMVLLGCVLLIIFLELIRRRETDIVLKEKSAEYVNDAMQAEKSRAETRIEKLSDHEVAKELDKVGGPGDP